MLVIHKRQHQHTDPAKLNSPEGVLRGMNTREGDSAICHRHRRHLRSRRSRRCESVAVTGGGQVDK